MKSTVKVFVMLMASWVCSGWGFFGHEHINRLAVFSLPPEMIVFYKRNLNYLVEASVNPDRRRYAVKEEGPRHYIDLDVYGGRHLPKYWKDAVDSLGEDSLVKHGIVPWHIAWMTDRLREAFFVRDPDRILRLSAELAHYVSDANVPLHTTRNHNGQLTNQHGIHGLWESRLPELFYLRYNTLVGRATYEPDVSRRAWEAVYRAHGAVDSVLTEDRLLSINHGGIRYAYETRGKQTVRVFSSDYAARYHERLQGMVERQLRASVRMTADLWYSAWVDAGQPDLRQLLDYRPSEEDIRKRRAEWETWKQRTYPARDHETGGN